MNLDLDFILWVAVFSGIGENATNPLYEPSGVTIDVQRRGFFDRYCYTVLLDLELRLLRLDGLRDDVSTVDGTFVEMNSALRKSRYI